MKFKLGNSANVTVVNVTKDDKLFENNELLQALLDKDIFTGKKQQIYFDYSPTNDSTLYLGVGDLDKLTVDDVRRAYHKVGKTLGKYKVVDVNVDTNLFTTNTTAYTEAAIEGLLQSQSVFDKYLSKKKFKKSLENVYLKDVAKVDVIKIAEQFEVVFEGIELTRALVNERPMKLYPETLANHTKKVLEPVGVKVTILDKKQIQDLEMDALLAVNMGAENEPKFIIMEYNGDKDSDHKTALVGKGVTYDTGGYSMKPSLSMDTMFGDMAGAATVIGTMLAIAKAKLPHNVTALVAATENMVSGNAYKPGDIISSMSKQTIEVKNTDAEGRLTLADALWYAQDVVKADKIIDIATLTGACVVALGELTTAAITNNEELLETVLEASKTAGEPIWEMPTSDDYRNMVKSDVADLINTSTGVGGGTITAGLFLEHFVNEVPWVHLDIAGTAHIKNARGYLPQGATGVHVKTLYNVIKNQ